MLSRSIPGEWKYPYNFLCATEERLMTLKNYDLFNFFHNKCVR